LSLFTEDISTLVAGADGVVDG